MLKWQQKDYSLFLLGENSSLRTGVFRKRCRHRWNNLEAEHFRYFSTEELYQYFQAIYGRSLPEFFIPADKPGEWKAAGLQKPAQLNQPLFELLAGDNFDNFFLMNQKGNNPIRDKTREPAHRIKNNRGHLQRERRPKRRGLIFTDGKNFRQNIAEKNEGDTEKRESKRQALGTPQGRKNQGDE